MAKDDVQMSLDAIVLLVLGVTLVFVLGIVAKRISRSAAVPIDVVVGDEQTEVRADGKVLLSEPSLIRYTTDRAFGRPRLLNFSSTKDGASGTDAKEYRIGSACEEPVAGIVYAFVAGCCLRARQELGVGQTRPLRVNLVVAVSDQSSRWRLSSAIKPKQFRAIGADVTVVEQAG